MKPKSIWTWCGSRLCMVRREHVLQANDLYVCPVCGSTLTHKMTQAIKEVRKAGERYLTLLEEEESDDEKK